MPQRLLKYPLLIILLVACQHSFAQHTAAFNRFDWASTSSTANTPEELAQRLTANCRNETEKVRNIFHWITDNIAYALPQRLPASRRAKPVPMDSLLALKSVDEIVSYTVMRQGTAVCNGYARLFKTLCGFAGIRSELVSGYARTGLGRNGFHSNHTWNAVFVDSTWRLIDATWAAGYITWSNEFVRQYDDAFFFPDPEQFIYTHYPEDLRWSLLLAPPALNEFNQSPFRLTAFMKYNIASYAPGLGVIEAAVGDTVQLRVTLKSKSDFKMIPEPESDSIMHNSNTNWDFATPMVAGNQLLYTYVIPNENVQWLHLVFNDDVILRYRVNVRPAVVR